MNTKPITVGITIWNKEGLIPRLISGLQANTSTSDEWIFVLDNCTDNSEEVLDKELKRVGRTATVIKNLKDCYETLCNNMILREAKNDVIALFQDDIILNDPDFSRKVTGVIEYFGNTLGLMGGRSGFELISTIFPEQPVAKVSNWEHKEEQYERRLKSGDFAARTFLNRGPLVFTRDLINTVGYLDEAYYPQQWDEADYCAKSRFEHKKWNVVFQCNVISPLEWGSTRRKDTPLFKLTQGKHVKKNWNLFISRWGKYIQK